MPECQWTSPIEIGDCNRDADTTISFMGETIHVCRKHEKELRHRP